MIKSRYLEIFRKLRETGQSHYLLQGKCILVEEVELGAVTTKSGLVLAESSRNHDGFGQNRPTFVVVLDVGQGYIGEEGEDVPLESKPGDVLLLGGHSVRWFSHFGPVVGTQGARVGIAMDDEALMRFDGVDGYNTVYEILDAALAAAREGK